jgi:hypothetical protein
MPPSERGAVGDVRPSDVGLGFTVALLTMVGIALGSSSIEVSALDERHSILAPGEIVVAVEPVSAVTIDDLAVAEPVERSEIGTIDHDPAEAPPVAIPAGPPAPEPPGSTPVPPRPADAPPPPPPSARPERPATGIRGLPRIDPATEPPLVGLDDLLGFGRGGPTVTRGEADPASGPKDPYAYVEPSRESSGAEGPGIVGDEDGSGAGDPLAARAIAAYRQRLQRWLSVHFYLTDSGLPREVLRKATVRATIFIDTDRIVVGHTIEPGGHSALEAAARRALERVRGQPVPEPPKHYPGALQRSISVTFTCTETTCN